MGQICHVAPFGLLGRPLRSEELMPGAQVGTSEAVELQMSPFLPVDDRDDEHRKACGRVGDPDYDTLLVFGTAQ
eukprot:6488350-Alexandrium_andersonii.AAC.1